MIKMAGGLSIPVTVQRGIRQGCPLLGQLYNIIIEPLLCKLRKEFTGLQFNVLNSQQFIKLSAYADGVTVLTRGDNDVYVVKHALVCYGKALSAKVTWSKSDAVWCGQDVKILVVGR